MSRTGWRTFFIGLLFVLALLPVARGEAATLPDREPGVQIASYLPHWLVGIWEWIGTQIDPGGSGGTTQGTPTPSAPTSGTSGDIGTQIEPNG